MTFKKFRHAKLATLRAKNTDADCATAAFGGRLFSYPTAFLILVWLGAELTHDISQIPLSWYKAPLLITAWIFAIGIALYCLAIIAIITEKWILLKSLEEKSDAP